MVLIGALLFTLATGHFGYALPHKDYEPTPQRAVIAVLGGPHVRAIRTNIVGRYAAVLTRGGIIEGADVTWAILAEHFSFGWQPLDALNFSCNLNDHPISARDKKALMLGMPRMKEEGPCRGYSGDAGPRADVESIRQMMISVFIPSVRVSGQFALGHWYGGGGGERLFQRVGGKWQSIAGGGGAMDAEDLGRYGVPRMTQCFFIVDDPKCPKKAVKVTVH